MPPWFSFPPYSFSLPAPPASNARSHAHSVKEGVLHFLHNFRPIATLQIAAGDVIDVQYRPTDCAAVSRADRVLLQASASVPVGLLLPIVASKRVPARCLGCPRAAARGPDRPRGLSRLLTLTLTFDIDSPTARVRLRPAAGHALHARRKACVMGRGGIMSGNVCGACVQLS